MTTRLECIAIGNLLPHGAITEISNKLSDMVEQGELTFGKRKTIPYSLVFQTLKGSVVKMKPEHERIVHEAKLILKRNKIEIPKL